jgi:hypothetical protein
MCFEIFIFKCKYPTPKLQIAIFPSFLELFELFKVTQICPRRPTFVLWTLPIKGACLEIHQALNH